MKRTADVVVIGAGVHGASTAFHLAKAGIGDVVLLDKAGVASGPTAKSGAMIRPIFTEAPYIQLVLQSLEMMEHWDDAVGGEVAFVERGFLRFTRTFSEAELGGNLELMRSLGAQFEILGVDELRSRVPDATFVGDEQGLWLPRSGYADPVRTTRTLARAAVRHGVTLLEGVQVTQLCASGGKIEAVDTDQGRIETRTVVNCGGPWSARLAAPLGVALPVTTHRGSTSLFQRPEAIPLGSPIFSDGVNQVYFREAGDDVLRAAHFGWTNNPVNPDAYDETISPEQLNSIRDDLRKRFQSMRHGIYAGGFSAIYDMTPDAHPIIGKLGGIDGFWGNCGWSGNGFASAPAVGEHVTSLIRGQQPKVDLSMFTWPRPPSTRIRPDGNWVRR